MERFCCTSERPGPHKDWCPRTDNGPPQALPPLEFRPWSQIPDTHKRTSVGIHEDVREVWCKTFLGDRCWAPWMGTEE